ncbi:MAG: ferritin [Candidatus Sumerlaeota bacterium]
MLKEKMEKALNEQVNKELFSSYLYMSMVGYFEDKGLEGMASWMRSQTQEEMVHATKIFNFICERGGRTELLAIDKPDNEWDSPLAAFEAALEHEKFISKSIDDLVELADQEKDHATFTMLQWFVDEQVEEEDSVGSIVDKLQLVGDNGGGVFMIDKELAARTFVYPPPALGGAE